MTSSQRAVLVACMVAVMAAACIFPVHAIKKAMSQQQYKEAQGLMLKMQCYNCHLIDGKGGTIAPPLDGIARHRSEKYIVDRLLKRPPELPPNYPVPEELMYHLGVKPEEAVLIADYLATLPERPQDFAVKDHAHTTEGLPPPGSHFMPLEVSDSSRRGAKLYKDHGCFACHSIGAIGGHIGPNLAGIGARRTRMFIEQRIANGAVLLPKAQERSAKYSMPPSKLSASESKDLTNFLLTLPPSG